MDEQVEGKLKIENPEPLQDPDRPDNPLGEGGSESMNPDVNSEHSDLTVDTDKVEEDSATVEKQ